MTRPVLYFDLGSPYAYVAVERAESVLGMAPRLEPVLLGAIFKARGSGSWARTPARGAGMAEVEERAARYGLPPVAWPPGWPGDGLAAMRAATWAAREDAVDAFARAVFRRQFASGEDIADVGVLEACAAEAGLDPAALREWIARDDVKLALRTATQSAWDAGVRGVPTLDLGGELFYGDDQLERAAPRAIAGGAPTVLERLAVPIVQAPLAGGPSTPALAAAVSDAGGLGFVAAGYKTAAAMREEIAATRALTRAPFGVNVFAARPTEAPPGELDAYAQRIREALDAEPAEPRSDDDAFAEKVAALLEDPVPLVSFTFGCPDRELVERLHGAATEVWVTVTDAGEARAAAEAGADALVVQGAEAGGHRGGFDDARAAGHGLLSLIQLVRAAVDLPVVASGGIATGRAVAAVLVAGSAAAQIGTAFMRCPEAATSAPHREALARPGETAITRAFTGRAARGIVNRFMTDVGESAPRAYPAIHHMTAPIRAQARKAGDADRINLWAGETHELAREEPAGELVRRLHAEAREAARDLADGLG
jgi:nitronate monooxygenase